jgi:hypothetical protein
MAAAKVEVAVAAPEVMVENKVEPTPVKVENHVPVRDVNVEIAAPSYIGGLGALLTFLYAVFIALRTLTLGVDVPGYASLLVAIPFLVYLETKKRPIYVVRREFGTRDGT